MVRYAITIFLSAFLLFQVQPMIGKFILPWFGGSPAVWSTCMLFFQVVLLAGYSYAHWISSRLSGRSQMICHVALLLASLACLPIAPTDRWKAGAEEMPVLQILALLTMTIGLPYFLLSTTGPLLQESFRRETGRAPYRLYSLSNIGSLLALLTYPFLFEPALTLHTQIVSWSCGYALFVACCGWCALRFTRPAHQPMAADAAVAWDHEAGGFGQPAWPDIVRWLSLAACGSVMLLATTNQLCQEISSVPFLWVLPLALYLLSFIICFDHERWYHRGTFLALLTAAVMLAAYALYEGNRLEMWTQLAIYSATLFVCCMICHGELVRAKPAPQYATLFYLMVSAGGALGGVLVALIAPLILPDFWEYHMGLVATVVLAFFAAGQDPETRAAAKIRAPSKLPRVAWLAAGIVCVSACVALGWSFTAEPASEADERTLETSRNFYGVLRVNEDDGFGDENGAKRELIHGRIQHGFQYLDPEKSHWPTTYYGAPSGVGLAINHHPRRAAANPEDQTLRIGVVGLGCGTLAAYGRAGDYFRFYEINPEVKRISDKYFTYRRDSPATIDVVLGDARMQMEKERAAGDLQRFDVLAVDAFSSDAIPMHLLTRQCVELFREHLNPDGLLCLHISNRFLNLKPVARSLAQAVGCECVLFDCTRDSEQGLDYSMWVILTDNKKFLETPAIRDAITPWKADEVPPLLWTDDYCSLWQVLDDDEVPRVWTAFRSLWQAPSNENPSNEN